MATEIETTITSSEGVQLPIRVSISNDLIFIQAHPAGIIPSTVAIDFAQGQVVLLGWLHDDGREPYMNIAAAPVPIPPDEEPVANETEGIEGN